MYRIYLFVIPNHSILQWESTGHWRPLAQSLVTHQRPSWIESPECQRVCHTVATDA